MNIPVVALAGSDSNLYELNYAIPGNDASRQTIQYILSEIVENYKIYYAPYNESNSIYEIDMFTRESRKIKEEV